ncbi:hypothetical protein MHK_002070 [Candidatus Magnetomorum sp. HK-1]|nr:hypothetical protein MHK_002070 [Candidatus Magnetomorum sp. HK-1]
MKVGFLILRDNFYKNLGGTIDECMKRGYESVIFLDETMFGKFIKKSLAPTLISVPKFIHGKPKIIKYQGVNRFADEAISHIDVMVVFCLSTTIPKSNDFPEMTYQYQLKILRKKGIPIVSIYSHFYDNCYVDIEVYESVDILCAISQYSLEAFKEILFKCSTFKGKKLDEYGKYIDNVFLRKVKVTGSGLFDPLKNIYKKRMDRSIENNTDVVLFIPKIFNQPFMNLMFNNRSKVVSIIKSLILYKGHYFSQIMKEPNYYSFIKSLERMITQYQLNLICKSRPKHKNTFDKKLKALSKEYYSGVDDTYYPNFTSHQIMLNAIYCIQIRTFSVIESVIAGVPSLHFQVPIVYPSHKINKLDIYFNEVIRNAQENTLFNFEGCVWNIVWKDALDFIENINLNDLVQDPAQRLKYIKKFCGFDNNRTAAEKEVDAIESLF